MRDELLTNVSIYWLAGCITSSTRLYYEAMHSGEVRRISAKYCKARNPSGVTEGWSFSACMTCPFALFLGHFANSLALASFCCNHGSTDVNSRHA